MVFLYRCRQIVLHQIDNLLYHIKHLPSDWILSMYFKNEIDFKNFKNLLIHWCDFLNSCCYCYCCTTIAIGHNICICIWICKWFHYSQLSSIMSFLPRLENICTPSQSKFSFSLSAAPSSLAHWSVGGIPSWYRRSCSVAYLRGQNQIFDFSHRFWKVKWREFKHFLW